MTPYGRCIIVELIENKIILMANQHQPNTITSTHKLLVTHTVDCNFYNRKHNICILCVSIRHSGLSSSLTRTSQTLEQVNTYKKTVYKHNTYLIRNFVYFLIWERRTAPSAKTIVTRETSTLRQRHCHRPPLALQFSVYCLGTSNISQYSDTHYSVLRVSVVELLYTTQVPTLVSFYLCVISFTDFFYQIFIERNNNSCTLSNAFEVCFHLQW